MKKRKVWVYLVLTTFLLSSALSAQQLIYPNAPSFQKGKQIKPLAPLFNSIDENLNHVSMADLINGMPLVLITGSAS